MSQNKTGVSIILPLYNGIEFLLQAMTSVVNQTHENWELIIGINGHPPNSMIEEHARHLKRLFFFHQDKIHINYYETKGAPATLNAMANDAKYDYIAFIDADDYWDASKIEKQLKYINKYDVIGTQCRYIGIMDNAFKPGIPYYDISERHDIFASNPMIHSSILIKKELVNFEDHFVYDYNLWFKLFLEKKKFFNIPDVLIYHRVHSNSAFNNSNGNYLEELRAKWRKLYDNSIQNGI
jgi:teichuronic acid biosynthesis glycosyltransferase TuaG